MSHWPERWRLVLVLVIACLLYLGSAGFFDLITTSYGSDVGHYVITAQSLAQGKGYRYVNEPAQPLTARLPPLLPALLSPLAAAFPHDMRPMRLFAVLPALGAVIAAYFHLRRKQPRWALGIITLFAWSVFTVSSAAIPQTDLMFTLLLYLILAMVDVYRRRERTLAPAFVTLTALLLAAIYTRIVAVVLLAAVVLLLWLRGQPLKAALLGLVVALGVLPWLVYSHRVTGVWLEPGYATDFFGSPAPAYGLDTIERLVRTAANNGVWLATVALPDMLTGMYMGQVQRLVQAMRLEWLLRVAGLVITAIGAAGLALRLRRQAGVSELFVTLYAAVLLVDSAHEARYLLPLLPLLYIYLFTGLQGLSERLRSPWAVRLAGVLIMLVMIVRVAAFYEKGVSWLQDRQGRESWIGWLASKTPSDAVIISGSPRVLSFQTSRFSLNYPAWVCSAGDDADRLRNTPATYVALHPYFGTYSKESLCMRDAIRRQPSAFEEVFRDDSLSVVIYRLRSN